MTNTMISTEELFKAIDKYIANRVEEGRKIEDEYWQERAQRELDGAMYLKAYLMGRFTN